MIEVESSHSGNFIVTYSHGETEGSITMVFVNDITVMDFRKEGDTQCLGGSAFFSICLSAESLFIGPFPLPFCF